MATKFEVGKYYSCDSFFSVLPVVLYVYSRTDTTVTVMFDAKPGSITGLPTVFVIENANGMECLLVEKLADNENYITAEMTYSGLGY